MIYEILCKELEMQNKKWQNCYEISQLVIDIYLLGYILKTDLSYLLC